MAGDFDLELGSLWWNKLPPKLPVPSMQNKGPQTSSSGWSWEQDFRGSRKTLIAVVRFLDDLPTTKVKVTWDPSSPAKTVKAEQKHLPPPPPLSPEELDAAHTLYGQNIATWCEEAIGTTVGDGECWTMIDHALKDLADTYRKHGKEGLMTSQGRSHGYCILTLEAPTPGSNKGMLQLADVRRGDILEMKAAYFKTVEEAPVTRPHEWGKWLKGRGERSVRLANHTAVVKGVRGDVVDVVEQNGNVRHGVGVESYDLEDMQEGLIRVFRAVGEGWCPGLDPEWD